MKNTLRKVIAIILAIAAILSFAACAKSASDDTAQTTTTPETVADETTVVSDDHMKKVDIDFYAYGKVQEDLLNLLPEDGKKAISGERSIERAYRAFYVTIEDPYVREYLGSIDVPDTQRGWGWSGEHYVFIAEDGSYILSEEGKLQYWSELTLVWEIKIPTDSVYSLRIVNNDNDVVVIEDTRNHVLYMAYDESIKKMGQDVYDVDAQYDDLWWLTIEGHVYKLEDYGHNPQGKAELMATNAIALSNNMSDGPGWYVTGEANYGDDWSPVLGEFVPDR